jgi:hypothetical protein
MIKQGPVETVLNVLKNTWKIPQEYLMPMQPIPQLLVLTQLFYLRTVLKDTLSQKKIKNALLVLIKISNT